MQKLHLVGFTTDHRALILSVRRGARSGGYVLELDDAVTASIADALARRAAALEAEPAPEPELEAPPVRRPESALTVRELQSRLRAGRTVDDVAAEAGVEPEWVARFAPPVIAEQARVISATKATRFERSRLGRSGLPLGAAVYRNLVERGVRTTADELDQGWSARQGADGRWLVTLTYTSRGRRQQPTWELEGPRGPIKADDRLAAELAFVAGDPAPASPRPGKPPKVLVTAPTEGDREAARRVSAARKVAEAQLEEAVSASTKRDAEVARRGPTTKKVAPAAPVPSPTGASTRATATEAAATGTPAEAKPAKAKPAKAKSAKAKSAKANPTKAKPAKAQPAKAQPANANAAKANPAKAKPATAKASAAKAQATKPKKAKPTDATATKRAATKAATPKTTRKAPSAEHAAKQEARAPAASVGAPATAGAGRTDAVDAIRWAQAEAQAELDAFVARRPGTAEPAADPSAPATPAGTPVFRADLAAPAGRNGDAGTDAPRTGDAAPGPPRPRRRLEPLRAR